MTHQYSDDGDYNVCLTVEDDDGATDIICKTVTVSNVGPIADYNWAETANYTINFTDNSTDQDGTVQSWSWDFDDGDTSTEQNPSHIYVDNGTYNVCLTVWDDDNTPSDVFCDIVTVSNPNPVCDFTFEPSYPLTYQTIYFNSTSTDRSITNWTWDMDDGTLLYGQYVTYQYIDGDMYNVCLTVRDDDGTVDTCCEFITVLNRPSIVDFNWMPEIPTTIDCVQFNDNSSDIDGSIVNWTWDFGDGNSSYEQNPTHPYTIAGNYTVCLAVKDNDGATNEICKTITIINTPPNQPNIPSGPTDCIIEISYNFSTNTTDPDNDLLFYVFDWGDGNYSDWYGPFNSGDTFELSHSWDNPGIFEVKAKAKDNYNAESLWSEPLIVTAVPPSEIDTNQSLYDRGFRVMPGWDSAQEFKPSYNTLSRVDVYMSTWGNPWGPIVFQICEDTPNGNIIYSDTISKDDCPDFPTFDWVTIDISDISVTPGERYVIVLRDGDEDDTHNCLMWGWCDSYGGTGPYSDGEFLFRKLGYPTWLPIHDWDFTFRTHGYDT